MTRSHSLADGNEYGNLSVIVFRVRGILRYSPLYDDHSTSGTRAGQIIFRILTPQVAPNLSMPLDCCSGGFCCVLAGIFTARRVTRPLNALGAAVDELTEGNLDARAPESKLVEYDLLAKQFKRTANRLASNIANLESDRAALVYWGCEPRT